MNVSVISIVSMFLSQKFISINPEAVFISYIRSFHKVSEFFTVFFHFKQDSGEVSQVNPRNTCQYYHIIPHMESSLLCKAFVFYIIQFYQFLFIRQSIALCFELSYTTSAKRRCHHFLHSALIVFVIQYNVLGH